MFSRKLGLTPGLPHLDGLVRWPGAQVAELFIDHYDDGLLKVSSCEESGASAQRKRPVAAPVATLWKRPVGVFAACDIKKRRLLGAHAGCLRAMPRARASFARRRQCGGASLVNRSLAAGKYTGEHTSWRVDREDVPADDEFVFRLGPSTCLDPTEITEVGCAPNCSDALGLGDTARSCVLCAPHTVLAGREPSRPPPHVKPGVVCTRG